jgi:hypothetical protein
MQVGQIIKIDIYGRMEECTVLAIRAFGTIDVQRHSDGCCFRISGLWKI